MMRETSDLIEEFGDGFPPSEAHCGGWEGLGKDGGKPALLQITPSQLTVTEIQMFTPRINNLTISPIL